MAFRGYEADVRGVPMDDDGMRVDVLADLLAGGPAAQDRSTRSPTTRTRPACPWRADAGGAGRPGPPLRLPDPGGRRLPRARFRRHAPRRRACGRWRPTWCCRPGTFSKIFFPGVRLGWAAGPAEVISQLVMAKQNSDQCSGALGQRMLEEYGRGGHLDRQLVASRALYARRARLMTRGAGRAHARRHDLDHAARAASSSG